MYKCYGNVFIYVYCSLLVDVVMFYCKHHFTGYLSVSAKCRGKIFYSRYRCCFFLTEHSGKEASLCFLLLICEM